MLQKTSGIVFRTVNYSESSVIAKIYTDKFGIQTYIISGVRSAKANSKAALYRHGNLLDLVVYYRENANMLRISEAKYAYPYKSIPFHIPKSSLLLFYIEILNKSVKEEEANADLFHFLFENFIGLDETGNSISNHSIWFLLALSKFLGFYPSISEEKYFDLKEGLFLNTLPVHGPYMNETDSGMLKKIIDPELKNYDQIKLSPAERKTLLKHLIGYYSMHIEGFGELRSLTVLEELFHS